MEGGGVPVPTRLSVALQSTVLALLVVMLTGCGGQRSVSVGAEPTHATGSSTPQSPTRQAPTPGAPTPEATTPSRDAPPSPAVTRPKEEGPTGTPPVTPPGGDFLPITSADLAEGGRRLVVTYTLPTPCAPGLREARVTERPDEVVVTLYRRPPRPGDDAVFCSQVVTDQTVDLTLDQRLGDRRLRDGSSGREVPVGGR